MVANIFDYRGKRAHFIGIGGSSMSGLAGYLYKTTKRSPMILPVIMEV